MIKILFVCHGNICRSAMAELMLKDMVRRAGIAEDYYIESAATSSEELGNPVYPPARRKLAEHGIRAEGKYARRICQRDYDEFDLLIGMDDENMHILRRTYRPDPEGKIKRLLDYAGRPGEEVADPWYTGDFDETWSDLWLGLIGLLNTLQGDTPVVLDFSGCGEKADIYTVLRGKLLWQEDYGNNLDALYDILTGLPHFGNKFQIILPQAESLRAYGEAVLSCFDEAGVPYSLI